MSMIYYLLASFIVVVVVVELISHKVRECWRAAIATADADAAKRYTNFEGSYLREKKDAEDLRKLVREIVLQHGKLTSEGVSSGSVVATLILTLQLDGPDVGHGREHFNLQRWYRDDPSGARIYGPTDIRASVRNDDLRQKARVIYEAEKAIEQAAQEKGARI